MQRRRDQYQSWGRRLELLTREVACAAEVVAARVPVHADPVIESLEREVKVLRNLYLHDTQTARVIHREQIENAPLSARKRRSLTVCRRRFERRINITQARTYLRLQPKLGFFQVERIRTVGRIRRSQPRQFTRETLDFWEVRLSCSALGFDAKVKSDSGLPSSKFEAAHGPEKTTAALFPRADMRIGR